MSKKDEAMKLALEALEYIENNYMSLPKSGSEAITAIKQARSAPVQEPVAFNAGVPPLYPEMKDGETISVEYTNPPAAQKDIQRLSALVRAQQITIDKLEQARSAPVQEPVAWVRLEAWKSGAEWPDDCFTDAHADGLVPLYTTPPAAQLAPMQEPVEVKQITEALHRHGLTLIKTARGYDLLKLGQIDAYSIKEKT